MMTTQQEFRLRDVFNPAAVEQLAHNIAQAWPAFDRVGFATTINSQLEMLSFSGRNALIRFLGKGVAQRAAFGVGARSEAVGGPALASGAGERTACPLASGCLITADRRGD